MPFAGARPVLNRHEINMRPAGFGNALVRAAPAPVFHRPAPLFAGPREPLNRPVARARPAGLQNALVGPRPAAPVVHRPGPVFWSPNPWRPRFFHNFFYEPFHRPVMVFRGSWSPAVAIALTILGIGIVASICAPEAAPFIMPASLLLAMTALFIRAVAGKQ